MNHEYAHQNFKTLQRWESVEFNRDWNLLTNKATKTIFNQNLTFKIKKRFYFVPIQSLKLHRYF